MERKDEIKQILKHLLAKTEVAIDKSQYSDDMSKILKASQDVLNIAKEIEKYYNELDGNNAVWNDLK